MSHVGTYQDQVRIQVKPGTAKDIQAECRGAGPGDPLAKRSLAGNQGFATLLGDAMGREGHAMVRPDRPFEPSEPFEPFDPFRVRRSCLAVPASSERFISKAHGLPADEVFLDLEDAVAPAAKAQARANAVAAVTGDWGGRVLAVRVNDASTPWAHRDVIDVVSAAGRLDAIVLPKVTSPDHVVWLDLLLGQVEREAGLTPGRTGIEAQIEDAGGLAAVNAIAAASPRLEALVFGPADFMASVGIRSLDVGGQPAGYAGGDVYHYALMRILIAARAPRPAGHRRALPQGPRRRRLPAVGGQCRGARLRRQVGTAPGPDRRGQRGVRAVPGRFRARVADCRGVRARHRRTGSRRDHVRRRDDRRGLA
jgi:hypothetical protein